MLTLTFEKAIMIPKQLIKNVPWMLIACATVLLSVQTAQVNAQVFLTATDDANTSNDTSRGPTTTNDRSDFIEIRNFQSVNPDTQVVTTRKKVGYFKYDISGIDPLLFQFAALTGSFSGGRDGNGTFTVYGLHDGLTNADNGGTVTEANWSESTLTYSNGLGVDVNVATTALGDLGIDLNEVDQLGTITNVDGQPLLSNSTDLPLTTFLNADTNGFVTFLIADQASGTEWRMVARESSEAMSVRLAFFPKAGDTNLDGVVGLGDLDPIRMNYLQTGLAYKDGDLSGDGVINFSDFRIWKKAFLLAGSGSLDGIDLSFTSAPEPTAVSLALVGLFSAAGFRWRHRRT